MTHEIIITAGQITKAACELHAACEDGAADVPAEWVEATETWLKAIIADVLAAPEHYAYKWDITAPARGVFAVPAAHA